MPPPIRPKPASFAVQVFDGASPDRPFERIARLDAHFEKTHFATTFHDTAIEELKKQARAAGADAIIEIDERRSRLNETLILHVTRRRRFTSPIRAGAGVGLRSGASDSSNVR